MCHNSAVDRTQIIARLREHATELKAAGLTHIRLYGSVARGDSSEKSDVDLIVEFDPQRRQTLVSVGSLQARLAEILEAQVDLSTAEWMREPVRARAIREAILAF
jgi:uncharacterized protein